MIVDVQNDFCHPDGVIGRELPRQVVSDMCTGLKRLRDAANTAAVPVIFVRTIHRAATDSPAWLRRLGGTETRVCREGSWGVGFYELEPDARTVTVDKHRYSGFHGTELAHVLRTCGTGTVVVAGTATNVCVESTIRDACMLDFDPVIPADAACASNHAEHQASLANIDAYFGSVTDVSTLINAWQPAGAAVGARPRSSRLNE